MRRTKGIGTMAGAVLAALWIAGCSAGDGETALLQNRAETEAAEGGRTAERDMAAETPKTVQAEAEAAGKVQTEKPGAVQEEKTGTDSAKQTGALQGMRLSIIGDSISTYEGWIPAECNNFYPVGSGVTDVSQTWWSMLLDDTGMELCANNSSAGSLCAGDSLAEDVQCGCSSYRLSFTVGKQGKTPDLIIIYMGTNDLLDDIPLGDNDGTKLVAEGEIDNFSDAYCLMLDRLESEYPAAEICCCTLAQVGDWGVDQPFVAFENALGLTAADYSERIRLIAGNRGMQVADLYHCGIEIENLAEMTLDGVHLTPDGMKCAETAILSAL